jgi:uncharacterized protein YjbJ (UPF0337 family)
MVIRAAVVVRATSSIEISRHRAGAPIGIKNALSAVQPEELAMNWDRIEGNWKQVKGKVKEQWGKLTDDDLDRIAGNRDQLVGKIQNSYGIEKDEAEQQLSDWESRQADLD